MKTIYLDHNATTPMDKRVLDFIYPYLTDEFYNPSSIHLPGQQVREEIEKSRKKILELLEGENYNLYFTSGGTEADNFAIQGAAYGNQKKGRHIICSSIEHHAVIDTCKALEKDGFEVTYLSTGSDGVVNLDDLKQSIRKDTILVTVMHANNETGVIQPVEEIARFCREKGIIFHTDAVQTAGKIPLSLKKIGADLVVISSHKFYGPKAAGALLVRKGTRIFPLFHGGSQEKNLRPGTENTPGIIGMARALEIAVSEMETEGIRQKELRDRLEEGILNLIPDVQVNGSREKRVPGTLNVSIKYVEGEALLMYLSDEGIAASSGSACSSSSLEPSHVLLSMGIAHEIAHGSIRFSLGKMNGEEDVEAVLKILPEVVKKLRRFSPFGKDKEEFGENVYAHTH
ncbi:MAG TPA: cysteine desulfurase NifS [Spirochaetia bacterium]|nr:MAG: cysteine desulfurase NifS [Spirochaetes bacterium GWB1_36_13]HCL57742.1 cysteine desulfurase NifS [Spirochaetia bacterium]